jgi:hypothetical protein
MYVVEREKVLSNDGDAATRPQRFRIPGHHSYGHGHGKKKKKTSVAGHERNAKVFQHVGKGDSLRLLRGALWQSDYAGFEEDEEVAEIEQALQASGAIGDGPNTVLDPSALSDDQLLELTRIVSPTPDEASLMKYKGRNIHVNDVPQHRSHYAPPLEYKRGMDIPTSRERGFLPTPDRRDVAKRRSVAMAAAAASNRLLRHRSEALQRRERMAEQRLREERRAKQRKDMYGRLGSKGSGGRRGKRGRHGRAGKKHSGRSGRLPSIRG